MLSPHPPGTRPALTDGLAAPPAGMPGKEAREAQFDDLRERMRDLQAALGAEARRSLLIVIQGRDASGKDGVIKRVFGRLNPALSWVTSFKRPSDKELSHDYLWRIHRDLPPRGRLGIFNRSQYEDVLPVRVHQLVPEPIWRRRYDHINAFEKMLTDEGYVIRKLFLHISKGEQLARLQERLDDPDKNWKFETGDLKERARWDDYTAAYEEMLERCSTPWAPWYIVPADQNRPRDYLIAKLVVETLADMNPVYPPADPEVLKLKGTLS